MKRDDVIKKARVIARIDPYNTESGEMAGDDDALQLITELANENDRLENELAVSRQRYADAFFSAPPAPDTPPAPPEGEVIKVEDFLDL